MIELDRNTIHFIKLVRQYLESRGKDYTAPDFAPEVDLSALMNIATQNKCDLLVYHTIIKWGAEFGLDAEVLRTYKERILYSAYLKLRADAELKEVLMVLDSAGIKFMLLKGDILSSLYPDPMYRRASDADLFVSEEYLERTEKKLLARGYKYIPNYGIKYEKTYQLGGILTIEVHTRLFEDFYERNRPAIKTAGLEDPSSRRVVSVLDTLVETLALDHFLIYVICHHTKHFIAAGIYLRHLVDISVYIDKYHDQLNWEFIFTMLDQLGVLEFTFCILHICQRYLGMISLSVLNNEVDEDVLLMLLHDIVEKNVDIEGMHRSSSAGKVVWDTYIYGGEGVLRSMKTNYFPSVKTLSKKYSYAKKYPILLPIAWVHRAFSYIDRKVKRQSIVSPAERAKIAKERVALLKKVQIL